MLVLLVLQDQWEQPEPLDRKEFKVKLDQLVQLEPSDPRAMLDQREQPDPSELLDRLDQLDRLA